MRERSFRLSAAALVVLTSGLAVAAVRPPAAVPFGQAVPAPGPFANWSAWSSADRNASPALQQGADHLVSQQCLDGGWGWPHNDCSATYNNITGPIALGLLRAWERTSDPSHLNAAIAGGNFDFTSQYTNGEARFSTQTPTMMHDISEASGDPAYRDFAATQFFDALAAGTYGPSDYDTAGWIGSVQTARTGTWVNLRPWEFHQLITAADEMGNSGQAAMFLQALLDGLNTLDNTDPDNVYSDILGLAGGVRGLGLAGVTNFPAINSPKHSGINGINNLTSLASILAALQNPDGSWFWHSNLSSPGIADEDTQTTAYAVLALIAAQDAGAGDYSSEISLGRHWLLSMQDADGGFFSYPGGDFNTESEAEALTALGTTGTLSLNPMQSCVNLTDDGEMLTVTIDMSDQPVNIVGGQFFLTYDNTTLDFVSADVGLAPFSIEVFESVDEGAGTIDYAVGIPSGGSGTANASTLAVLTFHVLHDVCEPVADLVQFRSNVPPSRLTDDLGEAIDPVTSDLSPVSIDITPPDVVPPDDLWSYADAGTCSRTFDYVEAFDHSLTLSPTQAPGTWYTDRYAPAVFESASFNGDDRLHIGISQADSAANRPSSYSSAFYNTQGRKYDVNIPMGQTISGKVYLSSAWQSSAHRTGMWVTTYDSSNAVAAYPIIAYAGNDPEGPAPRFRYWTSDLDQNPDNGYVEGWVNLYNLSPSDFDRWWTCEIELTPTAYIARVIDDSGTTVASFTDQVTLDAVRAGNIIMQGYNYGEDYDIYWDDITLGPVGPVATDNCSAVTVSYERSDNASLTLQDPFPVGNTTITWTAIDECGNVSSDSSIITVDGHSLLDVAVELQPTVAIGPFDRCITFELVPAGGGTPVEVSQTLTFAGGVAIDAVEVPCGDYECIMARDPLHTLRRTDDDDFGIDGTDYTADFTGGDELIGGNLNDDGFIDILDFGIFIGRFGTTPGANTPCGTAAPHADITGDGGVNSGDFTFIQINFLEFAEAACSGAPLPRPNNGFASANGLMRLRNGPVASISVDQLERMGLTQLVEADLNGDGMLDAADVGAFMNGARPDHLADVDRSGTVDFFDLQTVLSHLNEQADLPYDVNGDGWVTPDDLQFIIDRVGMTFTD